MALLFDSYSVMFYLRLTIWHSRDGADGQFLFYLYPLPTIFCPFFLFHWRHSEDGVDFTIFILSLSFFYYLLSLFMFALQNLINALKKRLKISNNCKLVKKKGKKKKIKIRNISNNLNIILTIKCFHQLFDLTYKSK